MTRAVAAPAAVLWDMDGTLVDTEPYWFAAERELVESYGHDWPDHRAHAIVGFDLLDSGAYIRKHGRVPLEPAEIAERLLDGVIERVRHEIPWRPGALELLAELFKARVPMALVTMSWKRLVDPILDALPPDVFDVVVTGDSGVRGKPDPEPYLVAAERLGVAPGACVAIEDSPTGVRSAADAGCAVVGVPNMKSIEPSAGVTIVPSLDDVHVEDLAALTNVTPTSMTAPQFDGADVPEQRDHANHRGAGVNRRGALILAVLGVVTLGAVGSALALGGDDEGDAVDEDRSTGPPPVVEIDTWAPYWTLGETLPETGSRLGSIEQLSPFWYNANGVTDVSIDPNASLELTERFVEAARDEGVALIPSIIDAMPAGGMAAVLADPATRAEHIETLRTFADELDADGLDLDYEQFAFADGSGTWAATSPNWVAFIAELAEVLHDDGRTLTVSIPPVYDDTNTGDRGYWVYDHGAIAEHVDSMRIMAYDYSVAEPGPIAPLFWVDEVLVGVSKAVPEEFHDKLVLGIPTSGRNWVINEIGECPASAEGQTNVTARSVGSLAVRREGLPQFDEQSGEWRFDYDLTVDDGVTSCVQEREVRWVDAEGVTARVEMARRARWGGVALWALGYEDDAVWNSMVDAATAPMPLESGGIADDSDAETSTSVAG